MGQKSHTCVNNNNGYYSDNIGLNGDAKNGLKFPGSGFVSSVVSSKHGKRFSSSHGSALIRGEKIHMRREINLVYAVSLLTGIIIGSGIFVSPVSIIANCGSVGLSLVVWVLSGVLTICIALSYCELAGMMPSAGGEYSYFKNVIGDLSGFLIAWTMLITVNPCFYAVLALTTTNYLFKPFFPSCDLPVIAVKIFTVWILFTVVALNSVYVRYVARVQTALAAAKIAALIIIAIGGTIQLVQGNTENLQSPFEGSNWNPGKIAVSIYTGIFSYGGWQYLFFLIEEVQNPAQVVPRATVVSLLLVTALYFFTNLAYFTVLTPADMMTSSAVAVDFAERCLGMFAPAIPIFVACSTIGALNGSILGGSRIYFAAARDNLFPSFLSQIHTKYLTPWPSLWLTGFLSIIYILFGDPVSLIEYLGFISGFLFVVTTSCILYLRWKQPDKPRPIKVPLAIPVICVMFVASLLVLGLVQNPVQNGIGILIILSGVPVYAICIAWKNKPKIFTQSSNNLTLLLQKSLLVMSQEKED